MASRVLRTGTCVSTSGRKDEQDVLRTAQDLTADGRPVTTKLVAARLQIRYGRARDALLGAQARDLITETQPGSDTWELPGLTDSPLPQPTAGLECP